MSEYAVIVQNDESKWNDRKGELYHYPRNYKNILEPGCKIIYYKGDMKNQKFIPYRLSPNAYYFGLGVVGDSIIDIASKKKDMYCEILDYKEFDNAVPIKDGQNYVEVIPYSRRINYWRFGVREISKSTYERIISKAKIKDYQISLPSEHEEFESFGGIEGKKRTRFSSYYERNPIYRAKAIEIHGVECMACRTNFREVYGELGSGFIHVHHNKPISDSGPIHINPKTDMSVLCPNCHAMVHRKKKQTLSIKELKRLIHDTKLKSIAK